MAKIKQTTTYAKKVAASMTARFRGLMAGYFSRLVLFTNIKGSCIIFLVGFLLC